MAAGKQTDRQVFDDLLLANDCFAEFGAKSIVGATQFVDGRDIVRRQTMRSKRGRGRGRLDGWSDDFFRLIAERGGGRKGGGVILCWFHACGVGAKRKLDEAIDLSSLG